MTQGGRQGRGGACAAEAAAARAAAERREGGGGGGGGSSSGDGGVIPRKPNPKRCNLCQPLCLTLFGFSRRSVCSSAKHEAAGPLI
ncbi:hypothetical protein MHYP_G00300750 [Metynnis hypsauchen]